MTTSMISNSEVTTRGKAVWPIPEIQAWAMTREHAMPRDRGTCHAGIAEYLGQLLADTVTLRDMYALHRRKTAGPALQQRHLLYDRHFAGQHVLVDEIAQRVQTLGGVTTAPAHDLTERTLIPRVPDGFEEHAAHLSRLLEAHEIVLVVSRAAMHEISKFGTDEPTVSNVIRTNEAHVWSLVMHMAQEQT
jgi:starvation-inducible DNA-binding protein